MNHPPLLSDAPLLDEGFSAYAVRGEGLSGKVDDLVTYLVVTCYDKTTVAAAGRRTHIKVLQATAAFSFKVEGAHGITCTHIFYIMLR